MEDCTSGMRYELALIEAEKCLRKYLVNKQVAFSYKYIYLRLSSRYYV
jgi:hypothetical protein